MTTIGLLSLRRQWRLNLAILLSMTLASALLALSSGYGRLVATQELQQSLEETSPARRAVLVTGSRYSFTEELGLRLHEILGDVLKEHLVIRHARSVLDQPLLVRVAGQEMLARSLELYSFNLLSESVQVVDGRLPAQVRLYQATESWRPPPIEAVIGRRAAEQSYLHVGDRVSGMKGYHRLDIVGIVEPLEPADDLWGQDLAAFEILTGDENAEARVPLIIATASMQSNYPEQPVFLHELSWRFTLNLSHLDVDHVEEFRSDLINLQTQSTTIRAALHTDLIDLLDDFLLKVSRLRTMVYLLSVQALLLVFVTLSGFASSLLSRVQGEIATLSARGASRWQLFQIFATETMLMALTSGLILGPGLTRVVLVFVSDSANHSLPGLGKEAWILSTLAAGLGWLSLALPAYSTLQKSLDVQPSWTRRPAQRTLVQRRYIDILLLVFGGLLTWQLNRSGSFLMKGIRESRLADPLLLIGPTLMVIAGALVFLRMLPIVFRLLGRLYQPFQNLVWNLSLPRLAREPLPAGRTVLLVGLTTGLVLFSAVMENTISSAHEGLQYPQHDALTQGYGNALGLNAAALTVFSLLLFVLAHLFSALDRREEHEILRRMGLPAGKSVLIMALEGSMTLVLGLVSGVSIGLALSQVMIPFFVEMLIDQSGRTAMMQIVFDWSLIFESCLILAVLYTAALILLYNSLFHSQAHWANEGNGTRESNNSKRVDDGK